MESQWSTSRVILMILTPSPDLLLRMFLRFVYFHYIIIIRSSSSPQYYGWTHSNNADSWFLEAHTPSLHEAYEGFYDEALKKRVVCPKLYSFA